MLFLCQGRVPGPLALLGPTSQCPVDQCPDRTEETFPSPVWRGPAGRLAMLSLPLVAASGCYGPTGPQKDRRPAGVPKLPDVCRCVELSEDRRFGELILEGPENGLALSQRLGRQRRVRARDEVDDAVVGRGVTAEVRRSLITTTVREESQVTPQGRRR